MTKNFAKRLFTLISIIIVLAIVLFMYIAGFKYFKDKEDNTYFHAIKEMLAFTSTYSFNFYLKQTPIYRISVLLNKNIDKLTGKSAATSVMGTAGKNDSFVELSDGYFSYNIQSSDVSKAIQNTILFADNLKKSGIDLIYLETPHRFFKNDPLYQKVKDIYPDYSEENIRTIRESFAATQVKTVSIGQDYPLSYFFKTDHHFLPQTGLKLCKALSEELNNSCGFEIDTAIFNPENYEINTDTQMLGSIGLKVTEVYSGTESLPILISKFKTDISVSIPSLKIDKTGTLDETLYAWDTLEKDLYEVSKYFFYGYGNPGQVLIHNNLNTSGKRVLVFKDSTANVVYPFFSLGVEYTDVIDLRSFRKNVMEYVDETKPDVVVMVYGLSSFQNSSLFNFQR